MKPEQTLVHQLIKSWKTSNRVSIYLIEQLPGKIWDKKVPGYKRKTIQMICGHLHNTRCMWIKTIDQDSDFNHPESVDRYSVTKKELMNSLSKSSIAIIHLLKAHIADNKNLNGFSLDAIHFHSYLVAHEAHHRGQIVMAARQLNNPLPEEITYGLWKWSLRAKEVQEM